MSYSSPDSCNKNTSLQNIVKNCGERKNRNSYEAKSHSKRSNCKEKDNKSKQKEDKIDKKNKYQN